MQCEFCGFANGEDDHRCLRCGRRTTGMVVSAPTSRGNNALALDAWASVNAASLNDTQDLPLLRGQSPETVPSWQPAATPTQKVIPFDQIPRPATRVAAAPVPPPARPVPPQAPPQSTHTAPAQTATRVQTPVSSGPASAGPAPKRAEQTTLDFTATAAPPQRTLTNGVPAANYCARPVATIAHRFSAAVMDTAMILLGFFLFLAGAELTGMAVGAPEILGTGKAFLMLLGAFLFGVTAFYSIIWMFAGRETAGMRMAGLELITFDNAPLDPLTRLVRVATTWLSIGSAGLGVIWAIADEEKLTWQDHISKSFPTFREGGAAYVRQHRP